VLRVEVVLLVIPAWIAGIQIARMQGALRCEVAFHGNWIPAVPAGMTRDEKIDAAATHR
jgi:hypothetical protein